MLRRLRTIALWALGIAGCDAQKAPPPVFAPSSEAEAQPPPALRAQAGDSGVVEQGEAGDRESALAQLQRETGVQWIENGAVGQDSVLHLRARGNSGVVLGGQKPEAVALSFLARYAGVFGMKDPSTELVVLTSGTDPLGLSYATFVQRVHQVPVDGARVTVLFDRAGRLGSVSSGYVPGLDRLSSTPALSAADARARALDDVRAREGAGFAAANIPKPGAGVTLMFALHGGAMVLVYEVDDAYEPQGTTSPRMLHLRHVVDAQTGAILERADLLKD